MPLFLVLLVESEAIKTTVFFHYQLQSVSYTSVLLCYDINEFHKHKLGITEENSLKVFFSYCP